MDDSFNGYTNYETWNVALNIENDEGLYHLARRCRDYSRLVLELKELNIHETIDGVAFSSLELNIEELNSVLFE